MRADRYAAEARIVPVLGELKLSALTTKRIRDWHHDLAEAPKLRRTAAGAAERKMACVDASDPEAVRGRRATANRVLTVLKASLNHAFQEGKAASDEAWRRVKPYRQVDAAKIRYLTPNETARLLAACEPDFRALVAGGLATGCRYGELTALKVSDFDGRAGTIFLAKPKGLKARHVVLNEEGTAFFSALAAGRARTARFFTRADGAVWGPAYQQRPLERASACATIDPPCTFHVLRHTYASALAMRGVPMRVIADQLGHVDTRITEKHYAHLAPSYVAETVRRSLPALGLLDAPPRDGQPGPR